MSTAPSLGVGWATDLYGAARDSPVVAYNATLGRTLAHVGTERGNTPGPVLAVSTSNCALEWSFAGYVNLSGSWDPISYAVDATGTPLIVFGSADPDSRVYAVNAVTGTRGGDYAIYNPSPHTLPAGWTRSRPGDLRVMPWWAGRPLGWQTGR